MRPPLPSRPPFAHSKPFTTASHHDASPHATTPHRYRATATPHTTPRPLRLPTSPHHHTSPHASPQQGENLCFDVTNVHDFIVSDDVILHVDLNDEAMFSAVAIGTMELSALQFMMEPNKPVRQRFPLSVPGGKDDVYKMELELEVIYRIAKVGMAIFTLYEGRKLKSMDSLGKQDPYVTVNIGEKYQKKSKVRGQRGGGGQ